LGGGGLVCRCRLARVPEPVPFIFSAALKRASAGPRKNVPFDSLRAWARSPCTVEGRRLKQRPVLAYKTCRGAVNDSFNSAALVGDACGSASALTMRFTCVRLDHRWPSEDIVWPGFSSRRLCPLWQPIVANAWPRVGGCRWKRRRFFLRKLAKILLDFGLGRLGLEHDLLIALGGRSMTSHSATIGRWGVRVLPVALPSA